MEHVVKLGICLLAEYRRLDDYVLNQKYLEDDNDGSAKDKFKDLLKDLEVFDSEAARFIYNANQYVDGTVILLKSRQHEYVNDFEVDSPMLRDFYSYGIAIEQIMEQLDILTNGHTKKRKHDGRFHYAQDDRILYRDYTDMAISSKNFKRETLLELVFKHAKLKDRWVTAEEIESRRTEKNGYDDDLKNPNEWIRKTCYSLNDKARATFGIDYDLFEMQSARIRLNPKA